MGWFFHPTGKNFFFNKFSPVRFSHWWYPPTYHSCFQKSLSFGVLKKNKCQLRIILHTLLGSIKKEKMEHIMKRWFSKSRKKSWMSSPLHPIQHQLYVFLFQALWAPVESVDINQWDVFRHSNHEHKHHENLHVVLDLFFSVVFMLWPVLLSLRKNFDRLPKKLPNQQTISQSTDLNCNSYSHFSWILIRFYYRKSREKAKIPGRIVPVTIASLFPLLCLRFFFFSSSYFSVLSFNFPLRDSRGAWNKGGAS